jgi:cytochrome c5
LAVSALCFAAQNKPQAPPQTPTQASSHAAKAGQDPGEIKFRANCGRCHNPPEQISPRIAGTVLRHMRVRAMLSKEDEQEILKYIAP